MRPRTCLAFCAVVLGISIVPSIHAQSSKCQTVQFSQGVLDRFPRAREACLDVITRDGEEYAVFKADLLRVTGNSARVRVKLPDGTHAPAQTVHLSRERHILVDGKPVHPDQLSIGQELTTYVKVTEPVMALAPAEETAPLETAPLAREQVAQAEEEEPEMPATASALPLIGAGGVLLLVIGTALGFMRRSVVATRR